MTERELSLFAKGESPAPLVSKYQNMLKDNADILSVFRQMEYFLQCKDVAN